MNTIEILKTHNAWRRGDDTRTQDELGFSVVELGRAIDDAVRAIAERDQLRAELEKERERVRRYREDLARCRHRASYSIGNDDALKAQLGKVREIVNDALSAGEGGKRDYYSKDWRDEMIQDQGCTREPTND